MSAPAEVQGLVDHLFRQEYGKLVATLTRAFGLGALQSAEDLVQETLIAAMHAWPLRGVPDNPRAWLMQVAKNKALNHLKSAKRHAELNHDVGESQSVPAADVFLEADLEDDFLRMVFACCHPELARENQIGLILKTLCGFGSREAARALLLTEEAFNKRLYRAKQEVVKSGIALEIPDGAVLEDRLSSVYQCLYLLFNEGYSTTGSDELIRRDLCQEAMRLCHLVVQRFPHESAAPALLALMCFHTARFETRVAVDGSPVVLDDQDRSAWDRDLIQRGLYYLTESARGDQLSRYHLEATIAAQHCMAPSYDATNWRFIRELYEQLHILTRNPIVQLNIAIVTSELEGAKPALIQLDRLQDDAKLRRYPLFHATRAEMLRRTGDTVGSAAALERALRLSTSQVERAFLKRRFAH